jgi:hypothetical protein
MSIYFPTSRVANITKMVQFSEWTNPENPYRELNVKMAIPNFLYLFTADYRCPTPNKPFINLGYFKGKSADVEVIIEVSVIQHEVSLLEYYTFFAAQNKEQIIQQRLLENSDQPDLLLTKTFDDGQAWITRRAGYKVWMGEGAFIITLNMGCKQDVYPQLADIFFYMLTTFKLIHEPAYQLAERLILFSKRYPLDFATYIPQSWQKVYDYQETNEEMKSCFLKQYRGQMIGTLSLNIISDLHVQTPEQVAHHYLDEYAKKGLNLSTIKIRELSALNRQSGLFYINEIVNFKNEEEQEEYELTIYIKREKRAWAYFELFGIPLNDNPEATLINRRALELILEHFRT